MPTIPDAFGDEWAMGHIDLSKYAGIRGNIQRAG